MTATAYILLLWLGFAGTHMGLSAQPMRSRLVRRVGESWFRAAYSLVALAIFIPLVWVYFSNKHAGPWLWVVSYGPFVRWIILVVMGIAFVLLVAGLLRPSPAALTPGPVSARGVYLLTRHPVFMAFAMFGMVHLLPNGSTADVVFFGGFVLFALGGALHQDRRKLATADEAVREFYRCTPFWPFTGQATMQGLREMSPAAYGVGVGVSLAVRYFHGSWFGG